MSLKVTLSIENIKLEITNDITLITLLMNRLTFCSRKYIKDCFVRTLVLF